MRETVLDRAVVLGEYILDTGATVRATAKRFHTVAPVAPREPTSMMASTA